MGALADSNKNKPFQALGMDVRSGSISETLRISRYRQFAQSAGIDFQKNVPILLHAYNVSGNTGYNAEKDDYMIVNHTGKIGYRVRGNRSSFIGESKFDSLIAHIDRAISTIPTSIKRGTIHSGTRGFLVNRPAGYGPASSIHITDYRGRILSELPVQVRIWNTGESIDWKPIGLSPGVYFLTVDGKVIARSGWLGD